MTEMGRQKLDLFKIKRYIMHFSFFYHWIYRNTDVIIVLHKTILPLKPFRLIQIITINLEMVKNQVSLHTKVTVIHYRKD